MKYEKEGNCIRFLDTKDIHNSTWLVLLTRINHLGYDFPGVDNLKAYFDRHCLLNEDQSIEVLKVFGENFDEIKADALQGNAEHIALLCEATMLLGIAATNINCVKDQMEDLSCTGEEPWYVDFQDNLDNIEKLSKQLYSIAAKLEEFEQVKADQDMLVACNNLKCFKEHFDRAEFIVEKSYSNPDTKEYRRERLTTFPDYLSARLFVKRNQCSLKEGELLCIEGYAYDKYGNEIGRAYIY